MYDDWIDILLRASFGINIPELSVVSEGIEKLTGSGYVSWDANSGIRIQATTNGGMRLPCAGFANYVEPGQLIPAAKKLVFSGRTAHDWLCTADPVDRDGYESHGDSPDLNWDFKTTQLTLCKSKVSESSPYLRILMGPGLPAWPNNIKTETDGDEFDIPPLSHDWLLSKCRIGRVEVRKRSDHWFEVRVSPHCISALNEPSAVCECIARAFSFLLGRQCLIRGYETVINQTVSRIVIARNSVISRNSLLTPLGTLGPFAEHVGQLLGLAIDFFLSPNGDEVGPFLEMCWDACDRLYASRLTISSICLEGLLRIAADVLGPKAPLIVTNDLVALNNWLDSSPSGFSDQLLARLRGLNGMFGQLSANDILRDWGKRRILGTSEHDIAAWKSTRHAAAHGQLNLGKTQEKLQKQVSRHTRIQNLANRIVLQLMGYTGSYIDYSDHWYRPTPFPFAVNKQSNR